MRGLNHFVLGAADLDALRALWSGLGFTLTPTGHHPFGTSNTIIQLQGSYIELIAVTRPDLVEDHRAGHFSFSAFVRDYLDRHPGFAMVVFDSADAEADLARWRAGGLAAFAPFRFSRPARLPDGAEVTVGFALAHVTHAGAPWLGHFACQHFLPAYYAQPPYLRHPNGALRVAEAWVSGAGAPALGDHFARLGGLRARPSGPGRTDIETATGTLVLAAPAVFAARFGVDPSHPGDGPHLAGLVIEAAGEVAGEAAGDSALRRGDLRVVPPGRAFGVALGFSGVTPGQGGQAQGGRAQGGRAQGGAG